MLQKYNFIDKAKDIKIHDTESIFGMVKNGTKVGEEAVNDIFTVASEHYDMSVWGIVNAITEVSQKYTLEHRIVMERYAGVLLTHLTK